MIGPPSKPCAVPQTLCLTGLFACRSSNTCGCAPSVATVEVPDEDVEAFCDLNRATLAVDDLQWPEWSGTPSPEEILTYQSHLSTYWGHLIAAYRSMYERTCRRFHGCTLSVRLCFPTSGCATTGSCTSPPSVRIPELTGSFYRADSATLSTFTDPGGGVIKTSAPVNLPNRPPIPGAVWRIIDDGTADATLAALLTVAGGEYPPFPPQNLSLPAGVDGTATLEVVYDQDLDPRFVAAVYHLALVDADRCSPSSNCGLALRATQVSEDGYSVQLDASALTTKERLELASLGMSGIPEVDTAVGLWTCDQSPAEFATRPCRGPSTVAEMFWGTVDA